jgi:hypothetical protein
MANRISILKSEAVGVIPAASAMAVGEIAVNYADKKIFGKHPGSGAVVQVAASTSHKSSHATGGTDALTPADVGAVANGGGASTISVMTEAAYTALPTKDTNTIYVLI